MVGVVEARGSGNAGVVCFVVHVSYLALIAVGVVQAIAAEIEAFFARFGVRQV